MSKYGGCLVCGVVLDKDDDLLCHDCVQEGAMTRTGSKAKYVEINDDGPIDVTAWVEGLIAALGKK